MITGKQKAGFVALFSAIASFFVGKYAPDFQPIVAESTSIIQNDIVDGKECVCDGEK